MKKSWPIAYKRQWQALSQARRFARTGNMEQCALWVRNAYALKPLTVMQWWRLRMLTGDRWIKEMCKEFGVDLGYEEAA